MIMIRSRWMQNTYADLSHLLCCYSNLSFHFHVIFMSFSYHFHVIFLSSLRHIHVIFMSSLQYKGMEADYNGQGVDQLKECIEKIKSCPEDRRLIMTGTKRYDIIRLYYDLICYGFSVCYLHLYYFITPTYPLYPN